MKLPATYKGAYEKALTAAGGKPRRLNKFDDEDIDNSDSETGFDTPYRPRLHPRPHDPDNDVRHF